MDLPKQPQLHALRFCILQKGIWLTKNTKFFLYCGTEDVYLPQSRSIAKTLEESGYDMVYAESAGDHNWYFWNRVVREFLLELPLKGGN